MAAISPKSPRSANILEEKHPAPPMIGATPEQRAECRMWTRRVDLNICEPLANGYRFGEALKFFEKRILCAPEASPGLKMIAANRLQWLNGADGRRPGISLRQALYAGRHPALLLARFRQPGRPAAGSGQYRISPRGSRGSASGRRLRPRRLHRHCAVRLRRSNPLPSSAAGWDRFARHDVEGLDLDHHRRIRQFVGAAAGARKMLRQLPRYRFDPFDHAALEMPCAGTRSPSRVQIFSQPAAPTFASMPRSAMISTSRSASRR